MTRISCDESLSYVRAGQIPPYSPEGTSVCGREWILDDQVWRTREVCRSQYGMFAIVARNWIDELANWIGDRSCLEIMAGSGWLAKALSESGVDIVATDDLSWDFHKKVDLVFPVEKLNATASIKRYSDADVLIVSWPPYRGNAIDYACRAWGKGIPIVYIGEGEGGCTATDYFFRHFVEYDNMPYIPLLAWPGLHDRVMIGEWHD